MPHSAATWSRGTRSQSAAPGSVSASAAGAATSDPAPSSAARPDATAVRRMLVLIADLLFRLGLHPSPTARRISCRDRQPAVRSVTAPSGDESACAAGCMDSVSTLSEVRPAEVDSTPARAVRPRRLVPLLAVASGVAVADNYYLQPLLALVGADLGREQRRGRRGGRAGAARLRARACCSSSRSATSSTAARSSPASSA